MLTDEQCIIIENNICDDIIVEFDKIKEYIQTKVIQDKIIEYEILSLMLLELKKGLSKGIDEENYKLPNGVLYALKMIDYFEKDNNYKADEYKKMFFNYKRKIFVYLQDHILDLKTTCDEDYKFWNENKIYDVETDSFAICNLYVTKEYLSRYINLSINQLKEKFKTEFNYKGKNFEVKAKPYEKDENYLMKIEWVCKSENKKEDLKKIMKNMMKDLNKDLTFVLYSRNKDFVSNNLYLNKLKELDLSWSIKNKSDKNNKKKI